MATGIEQPELYWTKPNDHCPNSHFPVLVYRNVLPKDHSLESARNLFESNNWSYDRCWKHDPRAHFHTTTHECYAALRGSSVCLYGVGPLDDQSEGVMFSLSAGDVAIHASGVSHKNLESTEDFTYMGVYPKGPPCNDSHASICDLQDTKVKLQEARKIPIPESDPIYGVDGPLRTIWKEASVANVANQTP